jgi:hypothetical protein
MLTTKFALPVWIVGAVGASQCARPSQVETAPPPAPTTPIARDAPSRGNGITAETLGEKSPAIISSGNVNVTYAGPVEREKVAACHELAIDDVRVDVIQETVRMTGVVRNRSNRVLNITKAYAIWDTYVRGSAGCVAPRQLGREAIIDTVLKGDEIGHVVLAVANAAPPASCTFFAKLVVVFNDCYVSSHNITIGEDR